MRRKSLRRCAEDGPPDPVRKRTDAAAHGGCHEELTPGSACVAFDRAVRGHVARAVRGWNRGRTGCSGRALRLWTSGLLMGLLLLLPLCLRTLWLLRS